MFRSVILDAVQMSLSVQSAQMNFRPKPTRGVLQLYTVVEKNVAIFIMARSAINAGGHSSESVRAVIRGH